MANLRNLKMSPAVLMAVHGYHQFTPDIGALCGGYQGFLYPNPTTLKPIENGVYQPLLYLNHARFPSRYTPNPSEDLYLGLGVCNPGIYYTNPGHLLGLIDTFTRMSYGLRIIKAVRDGSIDNEFGISIEPYVSLIQTDNSILIIDPIDFTENPSLYIQSLTTLGSDILNLDPRNIQCALEDGSLDFWARMFQELNGEPYYHNQSHIYIPQTIQTVTFIGLFENVLLSSYIGLPEQFQDIINNMYVYSLNFTFLTGGDHNLLSITEPYDLEDEPNPFPLENTPFPLPPPNNEDEPWDEDIWPSPSKDYPQSIIPFKTSINTLEWRAEDTEPSGPGEYVEVPGLIRSRYTVLTPSHANQVLTGSSDFHKVSNYVYDYRSLTELNSVINLIPIQSIGMRYVARLHREDLINHPYDPEEEPGVPGPSKQRPPNIYYPSFNLFVLYSITDICFHVTVHRPETISININAYLDRAGRLNPQYIPGGETLQEWSYDWISRQAALLTSVTNKYNWDRVWHGVVQHDDKSLDLGNHVLIGYPQPPPGIEGTPPGWEEITNYTFDKEINLKPGCNCVRVRLILQNLNMLHTLILDHEEGHSPPIFCDDLGLDIIVNGGGLFTNFDHHFEIKDPQEQRPQAPIEEEEEIPEE